MAISNTSLNNVVKRLENICTKMEKAQEGVSSQPFQQLIKKSPMNITNGHSASSMDSSDSHESPAIQMYDDMISDPLSKYHDLSQKIGGPVSQQAELVMICFNSLKEILKMASHSKAPPEDKWNQITHPLISKIQQVIEIAEANRSSPLFNNLSVVSNSIPALGWINIKNTPAPYIKEMHDSGTFYSNKVIMEHKGKTSPHIDWGKSWNEVLTNLYNYVKKTNTTGLKWNDKGQDAHVPDKHVNPEGKGIENLKKVTDTDKNYKNKDMKAHGTVPSHITPAAAPAKVVGGSLESQIKDKKANTQLQGNKWVVEYHQSNPNIKIVVEEIKQCVYIYKCVNSSIQVQGKLNSICLDNCKKCAVVFDSVISQLEVTNSQGSEIQVLQKCPLMCLENCDGAQVYFSKESMDTQLISAKSTQINILVPTDEEGDYKEFPVPEQYKTVWETDHFVTTAVEKKG
ncbi:unnamed protein product [Gordionus sp. m RMFG-2023]|uniref:adenylyl cyclase-associated protein 1-like isoform X2 n=1 Tax=Gordionus sp. m RMFG-2023 TaxID=3053472 RepID=UPI0030E5033D